MDLTRLEMLNAAATTGSIIQAVQKVHHTSSNLTTRIRQLEADLGIELFIREDRRLCLSLVGYSFLHCSQQIFALMDEARVVVADDEPQGLSSLGSLKSTAAVRISTTPAHFSQRYPKIRLVLSTSPPETMIDGVLEGALGTVFVGGLLVHPGLEGLPAFPEETVIAASYGHAPIDHTSEVNGANVCAFCTNCSYRRYFKNWFHAGGVTPGRVHEAESYHGMLACMIAGADLTLIPHSTLESTSGHQQVSAWPLVEEWYWLTTWLVQRRGTKIRQLEAFIVLLGKDRQTAVSP